MKYNIAIAFAAAMFCDRSIVDAQGNMVKMCLFYGSPSGHARSDPIISQTCASDHVHTFYGPQNFHPNTSYQDIRDTSPSFSTSPFVENQSLYWHPTIYEVIENGDGFKTYIRAPNLETSPYYRWDNSVAPSTEAFPEGFRMIAHHTDQGAQSSGETGSNMIVECCDFVGDDEEQCTETGTMEFPTRSCDFVGIAFAMPTCWDGTSLGDDNDHKSHMAYTLDGTVAGQCPEAFPRRLPQVQLFVRINGYHGGTYQLSDKNEGESEVWHVDFFNGWQEGKLQEIIDNCPIPDQEIGDYNPSCGCAEDGPFLTSAQDMASSQMCDEDVMDLIIDEAINETNQLPRGTCLGPPLIEKSWSIDPVGLLDCARNSPNVPTPFPVATPQPVPSPVSAPVTTPVDLFDCEDVCWEDFHDCEENNDIECGDENIFWMCEEDCEWLVDEEMIDEDDLFDCEDVCWEDFHECEENNDIECGDENIFSMCEEDCKWLVDEEKIDEDELEDCQDEWCIEDQIDCFLELDRMCRHNRVRCLHGCGSA